MRLLRYRGAVLICTCFSMGIFTAISNAQVESLGMPCYGTSVRALGMGGASVAVVGGIGSMLANPAATAKLQQPVATLDFRLNTDNERYFIAGYLKGVELNKLGGGIVAMWDRDELGIGGRTSHLALMYNLTQTIGAWRGWDIDFGATIKMHRQRIAGVGSRTNYTFDVGLLGRFAENTWVGFSAINATRPSFNIGAFRKRDERLLNIGIAHWFDEYTVLAVDVWDLEDSTRDVPRGSGIAIRVGLERQISPSLSARIGALDGRLTLGLGFRAFGRNLRVDYAFADRPSGEDDIHMLGFSMTF